MIQQLRNNRSVWRVGIIDIATNAASTDSPEVTCTRLFVFLNSLIKISSYSHDGLHRAHIREAYFHLPYK